MCGIYVYYVKENKSFNQNNWISDCKKRTLKLEPRGPDNFMYNVYETINGFIYFGFQRLKINDLTPSGNQPFITNNSILVCNGEIYNSKQLIKKYNLIVKGTSDCEVIIHLYEKFGISKTLELLDGVFAFAIYDKNKDKLYSARDPYGVRPLFINNDNNKTIISSELKPIYDMDNVNIFPRGQYLNSNNYYYYNLFENSNITTDMCLYLNKNYKFTNNLSIVNIKSEIRNRLTNSVKKRLQSDKKIGCLLSGGLDSSLITSIVNSLTDYKINTYSIGLKGSVDLFNARKVAKFLNTNHHEIIFTEKEGLDSIKNVIYAIETWDTTTVRASIPMYLMCKYISENTPEVKVLMSGEGADEVCQGYLYFHNQPNYLDGHKESIRLINDLLYFDVLRSDRSVSSNGLEVRVPFLDKDFLHFYVSLFPSLRSPDKKKGEKWLLRESFDNKQYLPDEILWRRKDGLSDGCSSLTRPWYCVLQEKAELEIKDEEFVISKSEYKHCPPKTKETLMYRKIFDTLFVGKNMDKLTPYEWLPKWSGNLTNPSGRLISAFNS